MTTPHRKRKSQLDDLVRMLSLIPYFKAHPGRSMMEAAADLGSTPEQVKNDLFRLFCCGPGTYPDELVDMEADFKSVQILNSQGMDAPLRLTETEAGTLLLALDYLMTVPGIVNHDAVVSAAKKIRQVTGLDSAGLLAELPETEPVQADPVLSSIREAMAENSQLQFDYQPERSTTVPSRRVVSPVQLFTHESQHYLSSWDEEAKQKRTFKVDRISHPKVLATPRSGESSTVVFDANDPFGFLGSETTAVISVSEDALWLLDTLATTDGYWEGDRFVATVPLVSTEWLIRFILGHAGQVKILEPKEIVDSVSQRAREGLLAYDLAKEQWPNL